jgi:hypothetical protein
MNSEIGNTDKSVGFSENRRVIFGWFVLKIGLFLSKIGKQNEKP